MNKTNIETFSNIATKYDSTCIIVLGITIIGVVGNLLTLCALPYAKYKISPNFNRTWNSNYIFIWHLALVDFFGSINMTVIYTQFVFAPLAINNPISCVSQIAVRDVLVLVEAGAIASIAMVKMLGITKSFKWLTFCDKTANVVLLLLLTWAFGGLFYIGKFIWIAQLLYDTLKNEQKNQVFDCGMFFYEVNSSKITLYSEFVAHILVFLVVIGSYITIVIYVKRTSKNILISRMTQKDSKTTKIIFCVCAVYFLQCVPYMIVRGVFVDSMRNGFFIQFSSIPIKICYIIYYTQFSINIFIYSLGKGELYQSYKTFLKQILGCFRREIGSEDTYINGRYVVSANEVSFSFKWKGAKINRNQSNEVDE